MLDSKRSLLQELNTPCVCGHLELIHIYALYKHTRTYTHAHISGQTKMFTTCPGKVEKKILCGCITALQIALG